MPRYDDLPFAPLPGRGASEDDLFAAIVYHVFTTLRVCMPATTIAWTPPQPGTLPATVDIKLDFLRARAIDNPGEVKPQEGETLVTETAGLKAVGPYSGAGAFRRVPIVYPGAGPEFNLRGPVKIGTVGLYIVADRCVDQWLNTGGPLDPATADKHDINDGFFLPLVYHGKNTPTISADVHQLGPDDGTAGLEIATATDKSIRVFTDGPTAEIDATTQVKIGAGAIDPIAKSPDLVSAMDTAIAAAIAAAVPNDGGKAAFTAFQTSWNLNKSQIAATKGVVE